MVNIEILYYNLDMIISLGYRIKLKVATSFRRWATERLKEHMIKSFTMDDYIKQLDTILSITREKLLAGAVAISHNKALEKAKSE